MKAIGLNLRLTLISNDRETLDGVKQYFERAGAQLSCTSRLEEAAARAFGSDAAFLFADDYGREEALSVIPTLGVKLVVVVTADVANFGTALRSQKSEPRVLVLARPAGGWMLLDAVRLGPPPTTP